MTAIAARMLLPLDMHLGEGPMWDARRGLLWFVDIKRGRVFRHDPATGAIDAIDVGGMPAFVLPADDGGYVLGNRHALHRFDGERATDLLAALPLAPDDRLNDATVDASGRLWFGTMDNLETSESGAVHLYDRGAVRIVGGRCCITNGPAATADGRHLYHVDTVAGQVWRFAIGEGGDLGDPLPFVRIAPEDGHPDGIVLDAEGHLWVALWGGWCARRYAPDGGLVDEVRFPVANVTKIALGGPDLRTAYATTARQGLSEAELAAQPEAGALFGFPVDTPGLALPDVRL